MEDGLRVLVALEHILLHVAITRLIAALAGGEIDEDFALRRAGRGIEGDQAALKLEGSVDIVHVSAEGPVNFSTGGVDVHSNRLRRGLSVQEGSQRKQRSYRERAQVRGLQFCSPVAGLEIRREKHLAAEARRVLDQEAIEGLFSHVDAEELFEQLRLARENT